MTTWDDVCRLCSALPGAVPGEAHEGAPAWYAGRHAFARLRWADDGAELLQFWSGDMDLPQELAGRRGTFLRLDAFTYRVSPWALLARLDRRETAELLLDSYAIRGGSRRRDAVDQAAYFAVLDGA